MLYLLTINVPVVIEEVVVDWLLEQEDINGFNSMATSGHGSNESNMVTSEKVTGRTRRVQFQTHLALATAEVLLKKLKHKFTTSDIHYMIAPLTQAGNLSTYECDK